MTTLKRYNGTDWEYIGLPSNVGMSPQTLGYSQVTAGASGTGSVIVAQVTITVPEGRRIRITGQLRQHTHSVLAGRSSLQLWEGAVQFNAKLIVGHPTVVGNASMGGIIQHVLSPSAGTHTYGFVITPNDAGTISFYADAQSPAFILVEDITGSTLPYQPASVPVGILGLGIATASQGGIVGSAVALTGLSVNVAVPAGRTLQITAANLEILSTIANDAFELRLLEDGNLIQRTSSRLPVANNERELTTSWTISPSDGAHTYSLTLHRSSGTGTLSTFQATNRAAYLIVEDITPTPAPSSGAPGSTLGYAEVTTSQGSITTGDYLTNTAVTITVPEGRRIKITGVAHPKSTVAGDTGELAILDTTLGALQVDRDELPDANLLGSVMCTTIETPSAGSHTYQLFMSRSNGTGTITNDASIGVPTFLLVEDITGSVWPEGSEVTAGMVASEAWTDWVPTLTAITLGSGTLVARYSKIGRTVNFFFEFTLGAGSAIGTNPQLTVPVPLAAHYVQANQGSPSGQVRMNDVGTADYQGDSFFVGANAVRMRSLEASGAVSSLGTITATAPFTWTSGDRISVSGTYEAAS